MRPSQFLKITLALVGIVLMTHLLSPRSARIVAADPPPPQSPIPGAGPIFAPNSSEKVVRAFYEGMAASGHYNLARHWEPANTATHSGGSGQGDAVVLTWSIIPDGTPMAGLIVIPGCDSDLQTIFNATYGEGVWQAKIAEIFETQWAGLTGNLYVHEPNDDGAAWPGSPGELGLRGDIRIGGCAIDGDNGILAYNLFPNNGDMRIDSTDSFYAPTVLDTGLFNVVAHEHGHGSGVMHVCPTDETKLMEPFLTFSFIGMQHDDIRAAQRQYGDRYESADNGSTFTRTDNDSAATASDLALASVGTVTTLQHVSIDDDADQDFFRISLPSDVILQSLSLQPIGFQYEDGDQSLLTGQCQPGTLIDSKLVHDLDLQLLDSDGTTVLATADDAPAGEPETLSDLPLSMGDKYIRIYPSSSTDDIQLYELELLLIPASGPTATATAPGTPTLSPTPEATATLTPPASAIEFEGLQTHSRSSHSWLLALLGLTLTGATLLVAERRRR